MSLQHNDQIYLDDDGQPLSPGETLELARNIAEQGSEAGFDQHAILDAEARLAAERDFGSEEEWMDYEASRGELAMTPERLVCYDCTRAAGLNVMDDATALKRPVVALGPVVNNADPTQTYKLACGHTTI